MEQASEGQTECAGEKEEEGEAEARAMVALLEAQPRQKEGVNSGKGPELGLVARRSRQTKSHTFLLPSQPARK